MTDDAIERLTAADPLPGGGDAPPFETLSADIRERPRHPRRGWRRRVIAIVPPVVVVGVSLAVLILAVTLIHARTHARVSPRNVTAQPSSGPVTALQSGSGSGSDSARTPAVPHGGMSGHVTVTGAGFNAGGDGVISIEQCLGCGPDGNETAASTFHGWVVSTRDGGRSWALSETNYYLRDPLLDGTDGWAGGLVLLTRAQSAEPASWEPGVATPRFFRSEDGGRSWRVAPSAAQDEAMMGTSLVDGEVWAFSPFGDGRVLAATIMHARSTGARLGATASQPLIDGFDTNTHIAGAGPGLAYVVNADIPAQSYVTHDAGQSWQRLTLPPCDGPSAYADLDGAFARTVWVTCVGGHDPAPALLRSLDGGRTWQQLPIKLGDSGYAGFVATGPRTAWTFNGDEELLRTTDAGKSWQMVWTASDPAESPLSRPITQPVDAPFPILSVQSSNDATVVSLLNRGVPAQQSKLTNLVAYRTTDGGRHWSADVVPLAPR